MKDFEICELHKEEWGVFEVADIVMAQIDTF